MIDPNTSTFEIQYRLLNRMIKKVFIRAWERSLVVWMFNEDCVMELYTR